MQALRLKRKEKVNFTPYRVRESKDTTKVSVKTQTFSVL